METLYWYDFETYGLSFLKDRPVQFVGYRTDLDLNIISGPDEFFCRSHNDYLPSLDSCLIHGRTPNSLPGHALKECDFSKEIHELLTTKNTCSVGYNTMKFDHLFTHHLFYRNLLDPYGWSWKNGNSKWDIIDLVRACQALRPEGINWFYREDGKPSFKLVDIAKSNGIEMSNAHDALCDVEATIGIAKLIKNAQPEIYKFAFSLRNKNVVNAIINDSKNEKKPFVFVSSTIGSAFSNIALVFPLFKNPKNNNELFTFDLKINPENLLSISPEEFSKYIYFEKNEPREKEDIGIRTVKINHAPFICDYSVIDQKIAANLNINLKTIQANLNTIIKSLPSLKILGENLSFPKFKEHIDVDEELYSGGFISESDLNLAKNWLSLKTCEKINHIPIFKDKRLSKLAYRYICRNHFEYLSDIEKKEWKEYCIRKLSTNNKSNSRLDELKLKLKYNLDDNSRSKKIKLDLCLHLKNLESFLGKY